MNRFRCPWCGLEAKHRRGCPAARFLWSDVQENLNVYPPSEKNGQVPCTSDDKASGEADG